MINGQNSRGLLAVYHLDEDEVAERLPALEDRRLGQRGAEQRHRLLGEDRHVVRVRLLKENEGYDHHGMK